MTYEVTLTFDASPTELQLAILRDIKRGASTTHMLKAYPFMTEMKAYRKRDHAEKAPQWHALCYEYHAVSFSSGLTLTPTGEKMLEQAA